MTTLVTALLLMMHIEMMKNDPATEKSISLCVPASVSVPVCLSVCVSLSLSVCVTVR